MNTNNVSIKSWLTNFTKSIGHSTISAVSSSLFPQTSEHISSAVSIAKETKEKIMESSVGVAIQTKNLSHIPAIKQGKKLLDSIVSDIKTGDFSIPKKSDLMESFGLDEVDLGFDETEFENEDGSVESFVDISNDAKLTTNAIIDSSLMTSESMTKLSKSMMKQNYKSTKAVVSSIQNMAIMATNTITQQLIEANEHLGLIREDTKAIVEFLKESQLEANNAAIKHYNTMEQAMAIQMRILTGKKDDLKEKSLSDQLKENGFDMEKYVKMVSKNFKNTSLMSSLSMMGTMGSMLFSFSDMGMDDAIIPMDMLMQSVITSLLPKNTRKAINNLDTKIPLQLNRYLSRLGDYRYSGGIKGFLAEIFGYDKTKYSKINMRDYDKGSVSWDGYSKRALEEVIPFYLSRIDAGINNTSRIIYDYKSGTYKDSGKMINVINDEIYGHLQQAFYPIIDKIDELLHTSDGNYKKGVDIDKAESIKNIFIKEIFDFLKNSGKISQSDFEKNISNILKDKRYDSIFNDLQKADLQLLISGITGAFAAQSKDDSVIKKFVKSSDYTAFRQLLGSGDFAFDTNIYGDMDIFKKYLTNDLFSTKTNYFSNYLKQIEQEKKKKEDAKKFVSNITNNELLGNFESSKFSHYLNLLKNRFGGGGKFDDYLAGNIDNLTMLINGIASGDIESLSDITKDKKFKIKRHIVPLNTVKKALNRLGIDDRCYTFVTEEIAGRECLYFAKLEYQMTNAPGWKKLPTLITPDMVVDGKIDLDKVSSNSANNIEIDKNFDIKKDHTEELSELMLNDVDNIIGNGNKKLREFITSMKDKASNIKSKKSEKDSESDVKKFLIELKNKVKNKTTAGKNGIKTFKNSMKDKASNIKSKKSEKDSEIKKTSNNRKKNRKKSKKNSSNYSKQFEDIKYSHESLNNKIDSGVDIILDSISDTAEIISETGEQAADILFNKDTKEASEKHIEDNLKESGKKINFVNKLFSEKNKNKLSSALKTFLTGLIGRKIFSRKGINIIAAATSVGGPVGVALAGLGAGILATKVDFRKMLLGEENTDKDGNLKKQKKGAGLIERIFKAFKANVIDEFVLGVRGFLTELKAYTKAQIAAPLKRLFTPLSEGLKSIAIDIKDNMKNKAKKAINTVRGGLSKALSTNSYLSRFAIRSSFFGSRKLSKGLIKGTGTVIRKAMMSKMKKEYKTVYGDRWKEMFDASFDQAEEYVKQIYDIAGKDADREQLKEVKDSVLRNLNPKDREERLVIANVNYLLSQYENDKEYKRIQQENRNQRFRMDKYHKAMRKSGNDINNISDKDLNKIFQEMKNGGVFGNFKNDPVFQRLLKENNREDMIYYLKTTGISPNAMAKRYEKRDKAVIDTEKSEIEKENQKREEKNYKNSILYYLSSLVNFVSFGKIPVFKPGTDEKTIGNAVINESVDEEKFSADKAKSEIETIQAEMEEKNKDLKERSKSHKENEEDDEIQSQGARDTRKGGFFRKKKNIYDDTDNTSENNKKKKSGLFNLLSEFGGIIGGGLNSVLGLLTKTIPIGTAAIVADLVFNNGNITKNGLKMLDGILNPFSNEMKVHGSNLNSGTAEIDNIAAYDIDDNGNIKIKNSSNHASSAAIGVATRAMKNAKGQTFRATMKSTMRNAVREIKTGSNILLHPLKTGKNIANKGLRKIWNNIVKFMDQIITGFAESKKSKSLFASLGTALKSTDFMKKISVAFHKVADNVSDDILKKFASKLTSVSMKMGVETAKDGAMLIPVVGQVLTGLELGWNAITGSMEAANLFAVNEEDVDMYMRTISSIMKAFFGFVPVAWVIPLVDEIIISFTGGEVSIYRSMAEIIYDTVMQTLSLTGLDYAKTASSKLDESQTEFRNEMADYNTRTGNNLNIEEYNDMKNQSVGNKISSFFSDTEFFWDSKETKTAKRMKKAYYEYGINSKEFKDLSAQYESISGKSSYDYLGINKSENSGYGFTSFLDNLFKKKKSAITYPKSIESYINKSNMHNIQQISEGYKNLQKAGISISKEEFDSSPEWNSVSYLITISNKLTLISNILVSQLKAISGGITNNKESKSSNEGYGFRQNDPRWANKVTGKFPNGKKATMATAGCGFSALAEVDRMYGGNNTPESVANMAMARGDVADGGAKGSLFERGINGIHGTPLRNAKNLKRTLKMGKPVIISGQASGYGFTDKVFPKNNKHLVVGKGIDRNGNVIVENPMYGTQKIPFNKLAAQTKGAWAMHKGSVGYGPGDKNGEDYIFYQQQDPQWANLSIGPGLKVGPVGCVNTAAAMAATLLNGERIDPGMMANNVFNPTSSSDGFTGETWNKLKDVYGIESVEYGRRGNGDANLAIQKATEALKEGKPVSLHGNPSVNASFSWNNKIVSGKGNQHDILAYGIDDNGNFLIADPSDATGEAGSRGKKIAAKIAPSNLINGLHWARIYSKNGQGVDKNSNFSAIANMSQTSTSTESDSLSDSASGSKTGNTGIVDIFSKITNGIGAIAKNLMGSYFSGTAYKRAINSDGSIIGTSGDTSGNESTSNTQSSTTAIPDSVTYGQTSQEVANIVNNSTYSTFNTPGGQTYSASFNPKYATKLNQDLGRYRGVREDQLNAYIEEKTKNKPNSVFKGKASDIIEATTMTGLDPRYILAHAAIETGWGTSSQARNKNNFFGIGAYNSDPSKAKVFGGNGFASGAQWIKDNFYNAGQKTLAEMLVGKEGHTYAVYDEKNFGRNGPNYHWANQIASTMDSMGFGPGDEAYKMNNSFKSHDKDFDAFMFNKMDMIVELLSVIASNTKSGNSGYGFDSEGVGFGGSYGNSKNQLNDMKNMKASKDTSKAIKEAYGKTNNDLGRSRLKNIHNMLASGRKIVSV